MLRLNLLPPLRRRRAHLVLVERIVRFWAVWAAVLLVAALAALWAFAGILRADVSRKQADLEVLLRNAERREIAEHESVVREANADLLRANAILQERPRIYALLKDIIGVLPVGVQLEGLTYDVEKREVTMTGTAVRREEVLVVERALQAFVGAEKVVAPVTNILAPANVQFLFTVTLRRGVTTLSGTP